MRSTKVTDLSFSELRDRLQERADQTSSSEEIDINDAMQYLATLPLEQHVPESVDALVQVAKNFHYAEQPAKAFEAASHAAHLAAAIGQKTLQCQAHQVAGLALNELGRFADAAVAHAKCWSLARETHDVRREVAATVNFGQLCSGMGQPSVASRYYEQAWRLCEQHGIADIEFIARQNFAASALELREPAAGLEALALPRLQDEPQNRQDTIVGANAHDTLASLYLLLGDLESARIHAERSARLAKLSGIERLRLAAEALWGHIEIHSGEVKRGLSAVDRVLAYVRLASHRNYPIYLSLCIDAYEAAGYPDKALTYLQELVDWKKKSVDAHIVPLQPEGFTEPVLFEADASLTGDGLLARAHTLQGSVKHLTRQFVEMAINAELASGHDLYRTFRVAALARHLALALGWDQERTERLALEAQLCNIGMIAVPTRILVEPNALSDGERQVVADHTRYGAELLRRSKLQVLEGAAVIAEQHHEWYDGTGLPNGVAGAAIAEDARVVAICDAFDAMTHPRPWRKVAMSHESALSELRRCAGTQFDPHLVNIFSDMFRLQFSQGNDLDALLAERASDFEYVRVRARMDASIADRTAR